jgi:hypothetical protein
MPGASFAAEKRKRMKTIYAFPGQVWETPVFGFLKDPGLIVFLATF